MLLYLMDIGLTSEPESSVGYTVYRIINFSFLPFALIGAAFCVAALLVDARMKKWGWFFVVLFFSFFFLGHLWMLISENIQAMRAR